MKHAFALLAILAAACASQPRPLPSATQNGPTLQLAALPTLGAPFSTSEKPHFFHMTSSASLDPAYRVDVQGVSFLVALTTDGTVKYISSTDPRFSTPEHIRVGSSLSAVLAAGGESPSLELGWAFHGRLPSGWHAAFTTDPSATEAPLQPTAEVRWLFLR